MIPKIETSSANVPAICFKCGSSQLLKSFDHEFRFRPLFGWVGIFVGLTYEYVWSATIFLCRNCRSPMTRMRRIAYLSLLLSFAVVALSLYLTYLYMEIGLLVLGIGVASSLVGIVLFAVFLRVASPRAAKVTRTVLQVEIPNYGVFDYTRRPNEM